MSNNQNWSSLLHLPAELEQLSCCSYKPVSNVLLFFKWIILAEYASQIVLLSSNKNWSSLLYLPARLEQLMFALLQLQARLQQLSLFKLNWIYCNCNHCNSNPSNNATLVVLATAAILATRATLATITILGT